MTWTPPLATIKTRNIAANLLTYITDATRQGDAYTWAGNSSLKIIKTVSNSVANRTTPFYPAIAIADDNDAQNFAGDVIVAAYQVTFEISIQNANPDTAATDAKTYSVALCSMIANCPQSTLLTNTGAKDADLETIDTGFLEIKANEMQNDFLQVFQIRAAFTLRASYHT